MIVFKQIHLFINQKLFGCYTSNDHFIYKIMSFVGNEFLGSHHRIHTPSNTFWTFIVGVPEPIRVFHLREYLALFVITRHKFLPFYSTVQLCWTSSNGTELTHQSPIVVLISTTHSHPCNTMFLVHNAM